MTLPRYHDAYHGLTVEKEKEELARYYLSVISKNVLVLPPRRDAKAIRVVLPVTKDNKVALILREIQLGADNGLYGAFQKRNDQPSRVMYEPPFYSLKVQKLIRRIISGCTEA